MALLKIVTIILLGLHLWANGCELNTIIDTLDCNGEGREEFPPDPNVTFRRLDVSNNNIQKITWKDVIQYKNRNLITHIYAHNNNITSIETDLAMFKNLEVLTLQYNNLERIGNQFANSNIKQLYLTGNDIKEISLQAFRGTRSLNVFYQKRTFSSSDFIEYINSINRSIKETEAATALVQQLTTMLTRLSEETSEGSNKSMSIKGNLMLIIIIPFCILLRYLINYH